MRNLSLRYKVPLRVGILIVLVAMAVTVSLLVRSYIIFTDDLAVSSRNLGRITARLLTGSMRNDDRWRVYEIINTPSHFGDDARSLQADLVIVLDADGRVFVSTRPEEYPIASDPFANGRELPAIRERIAGVAGEGGEIVTAPGTGSMYVITPILSDGVELGRLLMRYPDAVYTTRFNSFVRQAVYTTALIVALLLPMGWYWGAHMARPLVELARCMRQVGSRLPDTMDCTVYRGNDEVGQLGIQFQNMVEELREKQQLEKQMLVADRLAAIGRCTAGIAHEINNPLGGLLNATNTLKVHGTEDELTRRTVSLIERGLLQIKNTVGTLLVEARPEMHRLTPQDIEDTRTLALSSLNGKRCTLAWSNGVEQVVDLPSTHVRQVLINLLLNAVQAAPDRGRIACQVTVSSDALRIRTWNEGKPIVDEKLETLFEPFSGSEDGGRGLGLWVTYQIVNTLGGVIEVNSEPEGTEFTIDLPLAARLAVV